MKVSVVYARSKHALIVQLDLGAGATAGDAMRLALERAGVLAAPDLSVGVHGRAVKPEDLLQDGDRVEIYRPLQVNPKLTRRRRAALAAKTPR